MITEEITISEMTIEQLVATSDVIISNEFDIMNLEVAGLRVSMNRHSSEEVVNLEQFQECLYDLNKRAV